MLTANPYHYLETFSSPSGAVGVRSAPTHRGGHRFGLAGAVSHGQMYPYRAYHRRAWPFPAPLAQSLPGRGGQGPPRLNPAEPPNALPARLAFATVLQTGRCTGIAFSIVLRARRKEKKRKCNS